MHRGRRNRGYLDDELLHFAELTGRGAAAGRMRLVDTSHVQELIDHEALLDLLRWRRWELFLGPDRPAADLLAAGELRVRVADDRRDLFAVLQKEHAVHLDVLAGPLQTDDRRDLRAKRRCDSFNARVRGQHVLDVLGVDLRAVGEDDHVLLPSVQPQQAVLVERAEIARVVPAVTIEDRARRLLVLPVALEHVGTPREDLAVLGDLDLHAGQRRADRAKAVVLDAVERQPRGALGRSIALNDVDAQLSPRFAERGIERGTSGHDVSEAPAELAVNAEEKRASERQRQTARDAAEPFEELLLALRLGAALDREH